ncbi:MAG: hypothetical protein BAJALOKI3v1_220032 [Promethearchaeota archaeon]|nr:MAG: hypothetical protein BAJALOKI3v1_220032 [Candidatus Lokiarchaeota archaeon]
MSNTEKRILVTGGTGFIGTQLVKTLYELGYNLRLFVRETSDVSSFKDLKKLEYYVGDITNLDDIDKATDEIDVIFHLAAYVSIWAKDKSVYDEINVEATKNIADMAIKKDIRFLYVSSFTALGPTPEEPITESYEKADQFCMDYERTKYEAKKLIEEYFEKGLNGVMFYPGIVYGPGDFNIFGEMLYDIVRGKFMGCPGDGDSMACFSYVNDIVDAMINALQNEEVNREDFILGGENVKFYDYLCMIADLAGEKEPRKFPFSMAKFYAWLCELKAKITKKMPYITREALESFELHRAYSSEKAKKKLNYQITPLKEGLRETVVWYQNYIEHNKDGKVGNNTLTVEDLVEETEDIKVIV